MSETESKPKTAPQQEAGGDCNPRLVVPLRYWIVEIPTRVVHTMIVSATSRKDAEMKLRNRAEYLDDFEGCGSNIESAGIGRVVCEDKPRNSRHNRVLSEPPANNLSRPGPARG